MQDYDAYNNSEITFTTLCLWFLLIRSHSRYRCFGTYFWLHFMFTVDLGTFLDYSILST